MQLREEHFLIQETARRFAADKLAPNAERWDREAHFPRAELAEMGELRLMGILVPEEYGGAGLSYTEQMIYMEEMAEVGAPQEHHRRAVQQVGPSIILFGNEEQKQEYLPQIAKGELSFAMGLSEPDAGSDLASANTRAVKDGDFYTVNGQKKWTSGAHYSDLSLIHI